MLLLLLLWLVVVELLICWCHVSARSAEKGVGLAEERRRGVGRKVQIRTACVRCAGVKDHRPLMPVANLVLTAP